MKHKPVNMGAGWYSSRRLVFPKIRAALSTPELHVDETGCWDTDFPARLVAAIRQRGGFDEVSKITGLPVPQLKSYCWSSKFPSLWNCALIARACDVSLDWLMDMRNHRRRGRWVRKWQRLIQAFHAEKYKLAEGAAVAFALVGAIAFIWLPIIVGGW